MAKHGQFLKWRLLPIGNNHIGKIEAAVGAGSAVEIPLSPEGNPNLCYWNVQQRVEEKGGSIAWGWRLQWLPKYLLEAYHHAVWRNSAGALLDITPPPPGSKTAKKTAFIPDDRQIPDISLPPCVPNITVALSSDKAVARLVDVGERQLALQREYVNWLRMNGATFDRSTGGVSVMQGVPLDPVALDMHEAAIAEITDEVGEAIRQMEKLGDF